MKFVTTEFLQVGGRKYSGQESNHQTEVAISGHVDYVLIGKIFRGKVIGMGVLS